VNSIAYAEYATEQFFLGCSPYWTILVLKVPLTGVLGAAGSEIPAADCEDGAFGTAWDVLGTGASPCLGPLGIGVVDDPTINQQYQN